MNEYRKLCIERARELARKPYKLTAAQIAERTGICEHYVRQIIRMERERAAQG
ncbi:hypothetical protein [Collinsella stercoris]|uniref:hypothetical protein n=1 Tax=Collinsella stercoris TaxID=147206 RepID=UPI003AEFEAD3